MPTWDRKSHGGHGRFYSHEWKAKYLYFLLQQGWCMLGCKSRPGAGGHQNMKYITPDFPQTSAPGPGLSQCLDSHTTPRCLVSYSAV